MRIFIAASVLALSATGFNATVFAAGPGGHIPTLNPGSVPSGRTLPAMPTPSYGGGRMPSSMPAQPPRPTGLPGAGVTGTPAMSVGRPNSNATSRFPR